MSANLVTLPGDGIGPEIMDAAKQLLAELGGVETTDYDLGGIAIDNHGTALPDATLAACKAADAVLLAAVGGPKWDSTTPEDPRPE
ncbi:MAG: 3-isopropylmalate dehydrogenase, partial [Thermoleophilaceae bacterium]|nr:3-isopropylmalate dehydrogenase [Thermoleophilaceae bacterium]